MEEKNSPWPRVIIGFFAVVFAANFALVYMAVSGFEGLEEENYYEKGLRYNEKIQNEKRLGWNIELLTSELKTGRNIIKSRLSDRAGAMIVGARVVGYLRRPTSDRYDVKFEMRSEGTVYEGEVIIPVEGIWDIQIVVESGPDKTDERFRVRTAEERNHDLHVELRKSLEKRYSTTS